MEITKLTLEGKTLELKLSNGEFIEFKTQQRFKNTDKKFYEIVDIGINGSNVMIEMILLKRGCTVKRVFWEPQVLVDYLEKRNML